MGFYLELPHDDYHDRAWSQDQAELRAEVEVWLVDLTEALDDQVVGSAIKTKNGAVNTRSIRWVGEAITVQLTTNMVAAGQPVRVWHPCPVPPPAGLMPLANKIDTGPI